MFLTDRKSWKYRILLASGLMLMVVGYFLIIFMEGFYLGVFLFTISFFILYYTIKRDNERLRSALEGVGFEIDNKNAPLKSTSIEEERNLQINREYSSYSLEFLYFINSKTNKKIEELMKNRFPVNKIAAPIAIALMGVVLTKVSDYQFYLRINLIVFIVFIFVLVAVLWNIMYKNSSMFEEEKMRKILDFNQDIEQVIFTRLMNSPAN